MRYWIKILVALIIIFCFIFTSASIFFYFQGKAATIKQIESMVHKPVSIGKMILHPPYSLEIKDLNIEGLIKVKSVIISPSILGFFFGALAFNDISIIEPEVTIVKEKPVENITPTLPENSVKQAAPKVLEPKEQMEKFELEEKNPLYLSCKRFNVKDGKVHFIDQTAGSDGIKITVKDIYFKVKNLYLVPRSVITSFSLAGRIPWLEGKEEGKISADGWFNFFKKDMQADIKINDIDGIYLYPYYSQWVNLEKARIEKAKLDFTSNITGLSNNVTAECHLELSDIIFKQKNGEEKAENAEKIAEVVLDIFKSMNQGKVVLDFTVRTKMDRPEFGIDSIRKAVEKTFVKSRGNKNIVDDVVAVPGKVLEGTVRSAADVSKAVLVGAASIGKELFGAIFGAFKKEPAPKEETAPVKEEVK